ncbi:MAG: hypothetical protein JKY26_06545 [Pseudomonas sp.]|nr:hypothetical protein [Pseudomonas sp.]
MVTRKVGLDWIEARLNYIRKINTARELDSMEQMFSLDLDFLLHEHSLISLAEYDVLARRAKAEIECRRQKVGNVLQFPLQLMRALA